MKSWFSMDGELPPIDYEGDSNSRYPEKLVEIILNEYSKPGDYIFDPFCGFGTTLMVCSKMNRIGVGFEKNRKIYEYARRYVNPPNKIYNDNAENIDSYSLPLFDLLLCSPPFRSFRENIPLDVENYYYDLMNIFKHFRPVLKQNAHIVVEMTNLRQSAITTIPRAFISMLTLSKLFVFEKEYICCNTGEAEITEGYHHSYLMVFSNRSNFDETIQI